MLSRLDLRFCERLADVGGMGFHKVIRRKWGYSYDIYKYT